MLGFCCVCAVAALMVTPGSQAQTAQRPWPATATRPASTLPAATATAPAVVVTVRTSDELRQAAATARAGTAIRLQPGTYAGGVFLKDVAGTAGAPIVIEAADPKDPPVFMRRTDGLHLSACSYVTIRNIVIRDSTVNGINIDDGGRFEKSGRGIVLENVQVFDVAADGNHDGIKLSGLTDFTLRNCRVEGWGGQAIDMVGCHRGLIEGCVVRGKKQSDNSNGIQAKGGSSDIVIRRCLIVDSGDRGLNIGGSTGEKFLRPLDAKSEARDITVEQCIIVGCNAAAAFVGVDGATFRHNTIYMPRLWVFRILQESRGARFITSRDGRVERNIIVFGKLRRFINIGDQTKPESFSFQANWWYCADEPKASRPDLPSAEKSGVYGTDPQMEDPAKEKFTPREPKAAGYGSSARATATSSAPA